MFEKERFMFKQILASIAVATIAMVSPASSRQSTNVGAGKTNRSDGQQGCRAGRNPRQGGLLRIYKAR